MKNDDKRRKIQKEATAKIIENKFRGIVFVSPRVGKTKIIIDALNSVEANINVLVIAPRIDILKSWKEECLKWELLSNIDIDFLYSNSIKKAPLGHYHLIIGDECHSFNKKVMSKLRLHQIHGTRILGSTGTLDEVTQFHWDNILSCVPIYSYTFKEAVEDGIVADYNITCIGLELDSTDRYIESGNVEKKFLQTELEAYTYWNNLYEKEKNKGTNKSLKYLIGKRVDIIYNSRTKLNFCRNFLNKGDRYLTFTGRQNIADLVCENSYHSKSKDTLKDFINGNINQLATVNMISMGITIPNLKSILFNQIKSGENLAIQQAMRAFNPENNRIASIYVVYLKNTQDEVWVRSSLKGFESNKINWE
jgi:superfamily II DNA or RNA helicase